MDKWVQKYKCEYKLFDHRNHKYQSMFVKYSIRSMYLQMGNITKNFVLKNYRVYIKYPYNLKLKKLF